jgi:hypothetical protein
MKLRFVNMKLRFVNMKLRFHHSLRQPEGMAVWVGIEYSPLIWLCNFFAGRGRAPASNPLRKGRIIYIVAKRAA